MSTSTSTFPFFFSSTFSRPRSSPLDGRRDLRRLEASGFSASQLRFEGSEALRQRFRRDGGEGEGEGERGGRRRRRRGQRSMKTNHFRLFSFSSSSSIPRARAFPPSLQSLCASLSPWAVKVRCICPPSRSTASEWTRVVRRPPHAAAPQRPFLVVPLFDAEPSRASSPRRFLSRRIAVKRKAGLSSTSAF